MRRAAVSITNNIAEGFGRYHFQENIQFCRQARGSVNELIDDLNVCLDESYCDKNELEDLKLKAIELIKILNGYIASIRKTKSELNHQ
jgi:four helix bundle protein